MRKANAMLFLMFVGAFTVFGDHHKENSNSTMAMKPDPMVRQLDYFAGAWQCSGIAYANPMMPEHPTRAEVTAQWGLNGYWLPFTYAEKKTGANPMPFTVSGFMGYDAQTKQLVIGAVDSMGGYSTASSSGWNGDSMIFTGPWHMITMTTTGRDTFTKKSDREFTHSSEIQMERKWVKVGEETCKRGAR
jgi:Protein of unknown function (DUF1579)